MIWVFAVVVAVGLGFLVSVGLGFLVVVGVGLGFLVVEVWERFR